MAEILTVESMEIEIYHFTRVPKSKVLYDMDAHMTTLF